MDTLSQIVSHWKKYLYAHTPFLFIIATAAAFRLLYIQNVPGGLFPDEAANGLDINSILQGDLQPFYERGNGREALFFYLLTPAILLSGRTPLAHHLTSGLIGVSVVALTYLLCRRWFNSRVAFIASFLAAVSSWYVVLSRTAFRANTAPLLTMLFLYFATRVVQAKSRRDYYISAVLAGASLSLGFYTYISYRMMLPLLLLVGFALLIYDIRQQKRFNLLKKYWRAMLVGLTAAAITITPLILYFIKNPEWVIGRAGQVSILSPSLNNGDFLGTFLDVLGKTILGFFIEGDANWRHNVSGLPFISYLIAPFFVLGLIFIIVQSVLFIVRLLRQESSGAEYRINIHRLPFFILTFLFGLMLVPEVMTNEGIPHGLRLVGVIPVVFIVSALAIEELVGLRRHEKTQKNKLHSTITAIVIGLLLALEGTYGAAMYFGVAANSPAYHYAFRADLTGVSRYLNERNRKESTYLVIDLFSVQTVEYMTTPKGQPYMIIDPQTLWRGSVEVKVEGRDSLGLDLKRGDQVVFSQSTIYDTAAFEKNYPRAQLVKEAKNQWGELVMRVYEQK